MSQLMRLKETNPAEFEEYVQMAADAAKLAAEKPEVFASLLEGRPGTDDALGGKGESCGKTTLHKNIFASILRHAVATRRRCSV